MKKVFFLATLIPLLVCCATAITPLKPISQDDLKDLKGEWTGERHGQLGGVERVDLKIYNDSLPLEGEVTLHWQKQAPRTWFFRGRIENGRLMLFWRQKSRSLDLGLRKAGGKMKLEGVIHGDGYHGNVFLQKVQK